MARNGAVLISRHTTRSNARAEAPRPVEPTPAAAAAPRAPAPERPQPAPAAAAPSATITPLPIRKAIIPAGQPLPPQPSANEISPEALASVREVEKRARRLTLMELTERTCKWPIGDPATDDFWFCGLPSLPGKPYCEAHVGVAFQPMSARRDRRRNAVAHASRCQHAHLTAMSARQPRHLRAVCRGHQQTPLETWRQVAQGLFDHRTHHPVAPLAQGQQLVLVRSGHLPIATALPRRKNNRPQPWLDNLHHAVTCCQPCN